MSERALGNVVVAIKAVDEASSVMGTIQTNLGLLGGVVSGLGGKFGGLGKIISGFAAGGVAGGAIAAAGEIVEGLKGTVKNAAESEQAFKDLGIAVDKSGTAWDSVQDGTKTALDAMSSLTKYSNVDLAGALQRLLTYGMGYDEAMAALGPTLDFATAKQMDLTTAATLVGKGIEGNAAILKRYGVDVETSKDQVAALKDAHDAAKTAIVGMGQGVDAWVGTVTTAIGADSSFESGLAGAKDKAQYLIDQFQQGNIDLPQFTTAMTSLGVPLDEAKMKGGTAAAVLEKLNEQFGGTAQASTQTYAGAMDQLNNRMGELSIKIGTAFLPMLTGLTKGMTGLVNDLGPIVKGFGDWFGEVTNAPDFKALGDTIKTAFTSMIKDVGALAGAFKDTDDAIGKMLDALGIKTPEGFTALSIVAKGFEGLWDMLVITPLKITTTILQGLTIAFTTAADFINGPIKSMTDAIGGFVQWMKDTFQGFYDWLVGASLWTAMWNQMSTIAGQMIGQLISDLGSKLFDPMKNAFTGAMDALKGDWEKAWDAVQTATQTVWDAVTRAAGPWIDDIKTSIGTTMDGLKTGWETAWNGIQTGAQTVWDTIKTNAGTWMDVVKSNLSASLDSTKTVWGTAWDALKTNAQTIWDAIKTNEGTWIDGLKTTISNTMDTTRIAWETAWGNIKAAAQTQWDLMTTNLGTWTDGLKTKISNTTDSLKMTWETAWTAVKTTLDTLLPQIQTFLNTKLDEMKNYLGTSTGTYGPTMTSALGGMQGAMNAGFLLVKGDWQGALDAISGALSLWGTAAKGIMDGCMGLIKGAVDAGIGAIEGAFDGLVGAAQGALRQVQAAFNQAQGIIASIVTPVVQSTQTVTDQFGNLWQGIYDGAQWLWQQLVGGSIWPDLMSALVDQTEAGMSQVKTSFEKGLGGVVMGAPTIPELTTAMNITAVRAAGTSPTRAAPTPALGQPASITLPITINNQIDGATVARTVERRMIMKHNLSAAGWSA